MCHHAGDVYSELFRENTGRNGCLKRLLSSPYPLQTRPGLDATQTEPRRGLPRGLSAESDAKPHLRLTQLPPRWDSG